MASMTMLCDLDQGEVTLRARSLSLVSQWHDRRRIVWHEIATVRLGGPTPEEELRTAMEGITTVMDQIRRWRQRTSPGPPAWQAAWDQAETLAGSMWPDGRGNGHGAYEETEAAAALATAFYILTAERGIAAEQISRADIDQLVGRPPAPTRPSEGYPHDLPERWGARLTALGHDLHAQDGPVATSWR